MPLSVKGMRSSSVTWRGIMCAGTRSASCCRIDSAVTPASSTQTAAASTSDPPGSTVAAAACTPGKRCSAASISPSSTRYPLILTR
ncbi:Uncharacterised protein [Mycobacterium tuberculosis]|uniref:Uncharacterized protein n=1 Tax=Mycobacterium tuberculosis TaxID=1773 RepID=A0A916LCL2_MYCTX|nr:Uncharacterised protein [Mycobacterium tuberculosis]